MGTAGIYNASGLQDLKMLARLCRSIHDSCGKLLFLTLLPSCQLFRYIFNCLVYSYKFLKAYLLHIFHYTYEQTNYIYLLSCYLKYIGFLMPGIGTIYQSKQFYRFFLQTLAYRIFIFPAKFFCKLEYRQNKS